MTSSNDELDAKVRRQNVIIAILVVLMIGAGFLVVEERSTRDSTKALDEVQDIQYAQCNAANTVRSRLFSDALDDETMYLELVSQERDPEMKQIWRRAATRSNDSAESILAAARQRGDLPDPNQPVTVCELP